MSTIPKTIRRVRLPGLRRRRAERTIQAADAIETIAQSPPIDIAPNDPIIAFFQGASGAVDIDSLDLDSPGKDALKEAGVKIVVPLVSQGELIGLLNLGPRLSQQEYSADDRKLLADLASQAAPALRVGQLVRQQEAEAASRERIEQELRVAQLIQQQFLPKELPELSGWQVSAYYRPAREVGGDFYDFIELPDGKIGLIVGDVTDKGVPAALVMASTRSILRGDAPRLVSPAKVLERANELLVPDIPEQMFVTCLYGVLDPATGRFVFANAGHNLPFVTSGGEVTELRATGMPLGLMPGMTYEEKEAVLEPGQAVLLHSDGLAEAHDVERRMFGFGRVKSVMGSTGEGDSIIDSLLTDLDRFTGGAGEQEDDITLVTLTRSLSADIHMAADSADESDLEVLEEFSIPSKLGSERLASERVGDVVAELGLDKTRLERLKTAVAEATMNAIEHGNKEQPEIPVVIRVLASKKDLAVHITDQGGADEVSEAQTPDLEAKLAGLQKPRGWGLFLIKNMVDDVRVHGDAEHHTIELILRLKGGGHGN